MEHEKIENQVMNRVEFDSGDVDVTEGFRIQNLEFSKCRWGKRNGTN